MPHPSSSFEKTRLHQDRRLLSVFVVLVALAAQSRLTLCDPMDCSPLGSSAHGISNQEYWSGLPFPPPGNLPNLRIESGSPPLQAGTLPSEPPGNP